MLLGNAAEAFVEVNVAKLKAVEEAANDKLSETTTGVVLDVRACDAVVMAENVGDEDIPEVPLAPLVVGALWATGPDALATVVAEDVG